jgi:hypothetical protein
MVFVPVMQVGPMRVRVRERLVAMPMTVLRIGCEPGMRVVVVVVVVAVGVYVFGFAVDVVVLVLRSNDRSNCRHQHRGAGQLRAADRFAECGPREHGSRERSNREERLRARRAELLRGRDVERDADAVAERPDSETGRCGRG